MIDHTPIQIEPKYNLWKRPPHWKDHFSVTSHQRLFLAGWTIYWYNNEIVWAEYCLWIRQGAVIITFRSYHHVVKSMVLNLYRHWLQFFPKRGSFFQIKSKTAYNLVILSKENLGEIFKTVENKICWALDIWGNSTFLSICRYILNHFDVPRNKRYF